MPFADPNYTLSDLCVVSCRVDAPVVDLITTFSTPRLLRGLFKGLPDAPCSTAPLKPLVAVLATLSHLNAVDFLDRLLVFMRTHDSFRLDQCPLRHGRLVHLLDACCSDQRSWALPLQKKFFVKMPVLIANRERNCQVRQDKFGLAAQEVVSAALAPIPDQVLLFVKAAPKISDDLLCQFSAQHSNREALRERPAYLSSPLITATYSKREVLRDKPGYLGSQFVSAALLCCAPNCCSECRLLKESARSASPASGNGDHQVVVE